MTKGKAHGEDRGYQILARDIIEELSQQEALIPYSDDGIDVPFEMGGSTWTLDVALKDLNGNKIVVVECRRWTNPIEQEHIAAFAYKVELLRKLTGKDVAGIYFTKTHYREGAVKAGTWAGIELAICKQGQSPKQTFSVSYHRYDPEREIRIKDDLVRVEPISALATAVSPKAIVDGAVQD